MLMKCRDKKNKRRKYIQENDMNIFIIMIKKIKGFFFKERIYSAKKKKKII